MREAYERILNAAVQFANDDPRKPWYLQGNIFHTPPNFGSLELWYEPSIVTAIQMQTDGAEQAAQIMAGLTTIVHEAILSALEAQGEAFGALIMSEVRKDPDHPENWFRT